MNVTFLIRSQKYKRPPKILDLHSSFRATECNSINFTSWTSATCVTSPFARARRAFNVTAATDGNTGISRAQYRAAVQSGEGIDWSCQVCMETPYFETASDLQFLDPRIKIAFQTSKKQHFFVSTGYLTLAN